MLADDAIERIGAAAAQRDGEHDDAPHQGGLHLGPAPRHHHHGGDDGHLDGDHGGEHPREQAEHDADRTHGLEKDRRICEAAGGNESVFLEEARDSRHPAGDLGPAVDEQQGPHGDADQRIPEIRYGLVKSSQSGKDQLRLAVPHLAHDVSPWSRPLVMAAATGAWLSSTKNWPAYQSDRASMRAAMRGWRRWLP